MARTGAGRTALIVCFATTVWVAHAAADIFETRQAWQAAIAGQGILRSYDFEPPSGFPVAPAPISSFDAGHILFSSESQPATLQLYPPASSNQALTGHTDIAGLSATPFSIEFDPPIVAVGFDLLDLLPPGTEVASISVTGPGRGPTILYSVADDDALASTPRFFGLAGGPAIQTLDIFAENPACAGPLPCFTPNAIDVLAIVLVPEPAATTLVLASLFYFRRRRRTSIPVASKMPSDAGSGTTGVTSANVSPSRSSSIETAPVE
jgi:hypothetical protein